MALINTKCSACGANIKIDDSKETEICQYCGTTYIKPRTEKPPNVYVQPVQQTDQRQKPKYIPPRPKINCFLCALFLFIWPVLIVYVMYIIYQQKEWDKKYGG